MKKQVIKVKSIKNTDFCLRNGFFSSLEFYEGKNKYSYLNQIVKSFFEKFDFNTQVITDAITLFEEIQKEVSLNIGLFEETEEIILLKKQIFRYVSYRLKKGCVQLTKNEKVTINYKGKDFEVEVDSIFETIINEEKVIEVVKVIRSAPKLTMQKSKTGNSVRDNLEHYFLQLVGEKLYPKSTNPVIASYCHLKSKKDKTKLFSDDYEAKNNYVYHRFHDESPDDEIELRIIQAKIDDLSIAKTSITSPKCDKKCKDCRYNLICNYEAPKEVELKEVVNNVLATPKKSSKAYKATRDQQRAIDFVSGCLRINAGAGSGKTTILSARVSKLLREGVHQDDILLTTFTNKGAEEIREKIRERLIEDAIDVDANDLKIFTFNGLGDLIIKEYYATLGFSSEPIIADKVDKYDIIYSLLKEIDGVEGLDYRNPLMSLPTAKGAIPMLDMLISKLISKKYTATEFSLAVNEDNNLRRYISMTPEKAEQLIDFYYNFQDEFIERGFIQYQDQMNYMLQMFGQKNVLDKYAVKHIMVDEMQDTDGIQLQLIKLLYHHWKSESLVVVGDDSQAIFSFRYVTSDNIINFNKEFIDVEDIYLTDNFRSTPEIIYTANELNKKNVNRIDKNLISRRPSGKKPALIIASNKDREYEDIADKISQLIKNGRPANEIAVIARNKSELKNIQEYLNMFAVPSVMHTPIRIFDNTHVKLIASLGMFLNKPVNDVKLLEFINALHREELNDMGNDEMLKFFLKKKAEIYLRFRNTKGDAKKRNLFMYIVEPLIGNSIEVKAFVEQLKRRPGTFNELMKYLSDFMMYEGDQSVNPSAKNYEAVVLITAHSSKGKEYSVVFNTLNKYKFGGNFTTSASIEEERRLLFVSITRAKDELYLYYNKKDTKHTNFKTDLDGVIISELA